jgi:hypothetical protein
VVFAQCRKSWNRKFLTFASRHARFNVPVIATRLPLSRVNTSPRTFRTFDNFRSDSISSRISATLEVSGATCLTPVLIRPPSGSITPCSRSIISSVNRIRSPSESAVSRNLDDSAKPIRENCEEPLSFEVSQDPFARVGFWYSAAERNRPRFNPSIPGKVYHSSQ